MEKIITKEPTHNGLKLYSHTKSIDGFYVEMLTQLHNLLTHASITLSRPLVAHIMVDQPTDNIYAQLGRLIQRWSDSRHKFRCSTSNPPTYYLCTEEVRPRAKNRHMHIAVVFDGLAYSDLNYLVDKLQRYSKTKTVKLYQRSREHRAERVNQHTGEINLLGSRFYHNLLQEFEDAYMRISYICKVFSKSELKNNKQYSSSRIPSADIFPESEQKQEPTDLHHNA